ncbi:MAG: hypothetical protein Q9179_005363 [Wetmoreana sp. 5 TL-2023]
MGKSPAVVIIARHGARLDAADKQWHLTSPTPYDPPLTYGGWIQSRTLGNRIASILHTRYAQDGHGGSNASPRSIELQAAAGVTNGQEDHSSSKFSGGRGKKRKYKIIIHTSPFLRCIQTSVAIGAGIAHFEGSVRKDGQPQVPKHHQMHSEAQHPVYTPSPHLTGTENWTTPHLSAIPEPAGVVDEDDEAVTAKDREQSIDQLKPCLRIDAFLGEWLSPEYFDLITPPPSSIMMITGAKAELMRRGEYVDAGSCRNSPEKGNFPGGWGSHSQAAAEESNSYDSGPLSTISTIASALPRLNRASSHGNVSTSSPNSNSRTSPRSVSNIETSTVPGRAGYEPPTPSYAISPSDPIPPGYVAHARDACMDVDFQWDSMRQPHDWGNGGDYGEEWSTMHKRFRRGLQSMIAWYQHNHTELTTQNIIDGSTGLSGKSDRSDQDTDTVLVLVTHGAGCNALIGAITNQPVLLDVGMASLTMAVRKEKLSQQPQSPISPTHSSRRKSIMDSGISDDYEVKITASTEHLQARSRSSTAGLQHRSPTLSSFPTATHRYRTSSMASTASSSSFNDGDFKLDQENRAMTGTGISGGLTRSATSSGGLWSKSASKTIDGHNDWLHKEIAPQLSGHSPLAREVSSDKKSSQEETNVRAEIDKADGLNGAPGHPTTQHGLWGAPPATTVNEREKGLKRRWTHSEHR